MATEMGRRGFLAKAAYGAAGITVLGCSEKEERAPSYDNVAEVAKYLKTNLPQLDISDFKDNGGKLVYVFPDVHCTSEHAKHLWYIRRLNELMGLDLAGREGYNEGEVTTKTIAEEVKELIQEKGGIHQLAENEARGSGKDVKVVKTPYDFIQVSPLSKLAFDNDGITLVGLEDDATTEKSVKIFSLKFWYRTYFEVAKPLYEDEKGIKDLERRLKSYQDGTRIREIDEGELPEERAENERQFQALEEAKKLHAKDLEDRSPALKEIRAKMDDLRKGLEFDLPDYNEGIRDASSETDTLFGKAIEKAEDYVKLNVRSEDAARIMVDEMNKRAADQGALVYGLAHLNQIKEALDARKVSYLVIRSEAEKEVDQKLEALLKKLDELESKKAEGK
ncbi:hypothetical protein KY331_01655 [Candidatus Woesearchaeota archaeon]|nr:hypothetical protein [Candidatus Woesearchaeota archaeon]